MITVNVTATSLTATADKILTEGLIGEQCRFSFSADWDGLTKEAVFEGVEAASVILFSGDTVTIPPQVFHDAVGYSLRISVIGRNANGEVVIPTVWGKAGKIQASAASSEYKPTEWQATPGAVAQIIEKAGNAELVAQRCEALTSRAQEAAESAAGSAEDARAIAQSVRDDADAGKFQGPQGEPGDTSAAEAIAEQARGFAEDAKREAQDAKTAAQGAKDSAKIAENKAVEAAGKATEAAGYASAAQRVVDAYNRGELKGEKGSKGDKGDPGKDFVRIITAHPVSKHVLAGKEISFHVTAPTAVRFQWQYTVDSSLNWHNCTTGSYNTDTFTTTASSTNNGRAYRCIVTDADGNTETSNSALLMLGDSNVTKAYVDEKAAQLSGKINTIGDRLDAVDEVILETVQPLQKQADETERSLEMLWKLNKGQTYDIEQRNESGMNAAPSGAKWMTMEEVEGKTEQESTNGYNLLDKLDSNAGYAAYVTYLEDGSIVMDNKSSNSIYPQKVWRDIEDGDYTLSCEKIGGDSVVVYFQTTETDYASNHSINGSGKVTLHLNGYCRINVKVEAGQKTTIKLMLERGSVAHDFEPYTGGMPSPSPDYPQEIVSVDNFEVRIEGKNLCDGYVRPSSNPVTAWLTKGVYTVSAEVPMPSGNWYVRASDENGQIITGEAISPASGMVLNSTGGWYYGFSASQSWRLTVLSDAFISIGRLNADGTVRLQVERGETKTPYEPYTEIITRTITPPHPLNKISEYADKAIIDDGVWEYAIRKYAVQASSLSKSSSGRYWYYTALVPPIAYLDTANFLCNYFVAGHWNYNSNGICFGNSATRAVGISTQVFATAEEAVEFLNSHDVYALIPYETVQTVPIAPDDLVFLRSLELLPTDKHITVYDNHGRDVSYLLEYITKLDEVN